MIFGNVVDLMLRFSILLVSAEVPCKSMTYTLSAEPMCDVAVPVLVNFEIKVRLV